MNIIFQNIKPCYCKASRVNYTHKKKQPFASGVKFDFETAQKNKLILKIN